MSAAPGAFVMEQPADPPGRFVDVENGPIHIAVDGDLKKPCVVFIHGIPGSVRDARYLGPALARRGLSCLRIDLPGFGRSARAVMPGVTAAERAALVRAVCHAVGLRRFALAGHSIGGAVALALAALHPAEVTALALVSAVGVRRHRGLVFPTTVHKAMARASASPLGAPMARRLDAYYGWRGLKAEHPVDATAMAHHLGVVGDLDFVVQRQRARAVRCPTLVLNALDDALVEPAVATTLVAALESAPLVSHVTTPKGGHHGQKFGAVPIAAWLSLTLAG